MKITSIQTSNFIGARSINVKLTKPITIFAGKNGSGKSSLQEAIRMALTGETVRVGLKKDYGSLITDGAESGFAEVEIDGTVRAFITLPDGKTTPLTEYVPPTALPCILDAQRFAKLEPNERRTFLFGLMGLSAGGAEVKKRLLAKGCNESKVDLITPILRAGFDAAHKEAQAKARDEKSSWRTITSETYGEKKAATWAAEKPAFDAAVLADLQQHLTSADEGLEAANQLMGGLQADYKRHVESASRLIALRQKSSLYARIADKLMRDEAELKQWEQKVADLKDSEHSQNAVPCPSCDVMLVLKDGVLVHAAPMAKGTDNDIARLVGYEKALHLMQSAVANDKRDLAEADAAAKAIAELESANNRTVLDEAGINAARKSLDDIKAARMAIAAKLASQHDAERQAKKADEDTLKALTAHEAVLEWIAIADALAPDGIPGEIMADALTPLHKRLTNSAEATEWAEVTVTKDMKVLAGGRPYDLLSESEKWRADAMLAEAVAHISKVKMLVLDRFDVLDLQGREDLLYWLDGMALAGEIDTALIFGTLKTLPAHLPNTMIAHWLENGVVAQLKAAA